MDKELATTLTIEVMHELKKNSRRWFIAFVIMCVVELLTIIGFVWYISLPVDETTSIEQQANDIDNSDFRQIVGDDE